MARRGCEWSSRDEDSYERYHAVKHRVLRLDARESEEHSNIAFITGTVKFAETRLLLLKGVLFHGSVVYVRVFHAPVYPFLLPSWRVCVVYGIAAQGVPKFPAAAEKSFLAVRLLQLESNRLLYSAVLLNRLCQQRACFTLPFVCVFVSRPIKIYQEEQLT